MLVRTQKSEVCFNICLPLPQFKVRNGENRHEKMTTAQLKK